MNRNYNQYHSKTTIFRISPGVNSKDGIDFAMLFTLKTTGKPEDFRSCVVKGLR
jgi:hypothetical protein